MGAIMVLLGPITRISAMEILTTTVMVNITEAPTTITTTTTTIITITTIQETGITIMNTITMGVNHIAADMQKDMVTKTTPKTSSVE
jgi:hypothetical protein